MFYSGNATTSFTSCCPETDEATGPPAHPVASYLPLLTDTCTTIRYFQHQHTSLTTGREAHGLLPGPPLARLRRVFVRPGNKQPLRVEPHQSPAGPLLFDRRGRTRRRHLPGTSFAKSAELRAPLDRITSSRCIFLSHTSQLNESSQPIYGLSLDNWCTSRISRNVFPEKKRRHDLVHQQENGRCPDHVRRGKPTLLRLSMPDN